MCSLSEYLVSALNAKPLLLFAFMTPHDFEDVIEPFVLGDPEFLVHDSASYGVIGEPHIVRYFDPDKSTVRRLAV